jgi:hypothetical protein
MGEVEILQNQGRSAGLPAFGMKSTTDLQLGREREEERRARQNAARWEARLREQESLGATPGGRALFEMHAEHLSIAIGSVLEELLEDPTKAGPHYAAWPLLLAATSRGPRAIAAIALEVVVDGIGRPKETKAIAKAIGAALEREMRAGRVAGRDADLARMIAARCGPSALGCPEVLKLARVDPAGWCASDRREVGDLLLQLMARHLDLFDIETRGKRTVARARQGARQVIDAGGQARPVVVRAPMLTEPRAWAGMEGGGHLTNTEPLVRSRRGLDLSHLTPAAMDPLVRAVNCLQRQELRVSRTMLDLQVLMWDGGVRGLFPVARRTEEPPRPESTVGRDAFVRFLRARADAVQEAREGAAARARIEQTLRHAKAVAEQPIWLAHCADFRGRIYTANRFCTHQGPDHEKALLDFARGEPASESDMQRVRRSLPEDLTAQWDPLTIKPAEVALSCRGVRDPWQATQAALWYARWRRDPSIPVGLPVRFDQCCSGAAIVAALMRDGRLARLTNLIGDTPLDLYAHLAALLVERLQADLHGGSERERVLAEAWLELGIDRSTVKAPTMAALYGGSWLGLVDLLAAQLQAARPARICHWQREKIQPARYLARHLRSIFSEEFQSVHRLDAWLRAACRAVLQAGRHMEWTTPAGMLVRLGQFQDPRSPVVSLTRGTKRCRQVGEADGGELSARATSASLLPNVVHAFDASFCHQVVSAAEARGIPLLTNHDCFATIPSQADWLHCALLRQIGAVHKEDHLARMASEIAVAAGLPALSPPVPIGTLDPARIGENPHHFR